MMPKEDLERGIYKHDRFLIDFQMAVDGSSHHPSKTVAVADSLRLPGSSAPYNSACLYRWILQKVLYVHSVSKCVFESLKEQVAF